MSDVKYDLSCKNVSKFSKKKKKIDFTLKKNKKKNKI